MTAYLAIAEQLAGDITEGRLRPGERLPTQRAFAHSRGIATSTAFRVYAKLIEMGLVTGEVGRGTYVRIGEPASAPALAEPMPASIDLGTNFPILPDQHVLMSRVLVTLVRRPDSLDRALHAVNVQGTAADRAAIASALSYGGWKAKPESLLFAGNGRQALTAAFSALVPPGGRIGFEALTYPVAKAAALRLGFSTAALVGDEQGVTPDALKAAHRIAPLHAIYLQPTAQNPTGATMSRERREEIVATVKRLKRPDNAPVHIVEDAVYSFLELRAPPPLAALAPDAVVLVDSFSKRVSPGLTIGIISAPGALHLRLIAALRSGGWGPTGFPLEVAVRCAADGTLSALEDAKRANAVARQEIASRELAGLSVRRNPSTYHLLLDLPEQWRAEVFALAMARRHIAVTPAAAFAVMPAHAPNMVRIALANPDITTLSSALGMVKGVALSDVDIENE
ncbi:MAG: PLP-dependent aminotransferase family protein [Reyranella sp.]|jgi:DNA-binding transcriptional MocR family regulator|uniref:aminotransferase-like domain-containing protein n=1 Tax=Reyranella sp. TaxID=1929291 RepID=UPI000961A9CB|nr:PLP-dependent aminotransferase family protein [Reyranella sp.]MBR2817563.1 PLP-dependent aminotransferase family protein [Reyranella sp.]OJU31051.1 MAG: hypothetical protein BGN99_12740 [Alphaproteobacteria bacterium 65-37]